LLQLEDRGEEVTMLFDPAESFVVEKGEASGISLLRSGFHFLPGDRCGDSRALFGPEGIDANGSFVAVVLTPVHEDFSGAEALLHFGEGVVGMGALNGFGESTGKGFGDFESCGGIQRNIHLKAFGAGGFGKAFEAEVVQMFLQPEGDLAAVNDVCRRAGIEIKDDHSRVFDSLAFGEKGVEFEIAEVCGPDDGREIVDDAIIDLRIVFVAPDGDGFDPGWAMGRATLFVEKTPGDAVRVTL